jgi:CRISPR/Cas system CSM-associated protein Csm3 (group 7 of RAMP superfamily)
MIEDIPNDVFVRIKTDLLIVGDSIMTDRHHASNGNYEDNHPQNQISGIIPAFSLSGWLRHGMEKVVQERGSTACHPGEPNANFRKEDVYARDLDTGYHPKGDCLEDNDKDGCVIHDLFGGFGNQPGKVMRRPIKFSPVRSSVDYTRGQAEGHYRRLNRNVVSRNQEDNREPLRNTEVDAVANLDGAWHLSFREPKSEFIALLAEAIDFLDLHQTDFMHQLGGARNFGGGIVDCTLLNPLYEDSELRRVFNRGKDNTNKMDDKDEELREEHLGKFKSELTKRVEEGP